MKSFGSDNHSGVHPKILEAIARASTGAAVAYGHDPWTVRVESLFKALFGPTARAYLVFNGTAANVLALKSVCASHEAVLCSEQAHIHLDECGAPENYIGCKLIPVRHHDGKTRVDDLRSKITRLGDQHHVQAKVISIAQVTEMGTVYSLKEIQDIADLAHEKGMFFHMDGARISNAAVSLGVSLKQMTTDCGVDLVSFGGTKNGLLFGEAVLLLNPAIQGDFKFIRKQGMQLASKMRFLSAQFEEYLSNDLWKQNAQQANAMTKLLHDEVLKLPSIQVARPVQANALFVHVPKIVTEQIKREGEYFYHVTDERPGETHHEVRWMTAFDTSREDVMGFVCKIQESLQRAPIQ